MLISLSSWPKRRRSNTTSASEAEVNTIDTQVDIRVTKKRPARLLYDEAADADWLLDALASRGTEQVAPHRKGRKRPLRQNGLALRRCLKRVKIESTISWLQYQRRLLVQHEIHAHLFEGFLHLACMMRCLKGF
jgi:transposase